MRPSKLPRPDARAVRRRHHRHPFDLRLRIAVRRLLRDVERILVPATRGETVRSDDFRRVIGLIAILALGFFVPSLAMAGVPLALWPPFLFTAAVAGGSVAPSLLLVRRGSPLAFIAAFAAASIVAGIGWYYQVYYHQVGLLFALVVSAYAIVHGFRAALGAVLPGTIYVPFLIHERAGVNATDPVYAFIYLLGAALIPWTAGRLARRRAEALARQLRATRAAEREAVLILARAAEAKDEDTAEHVARVGDLSAELAARAGLESTIVEDLRFAAMLHDVGKLHVPDRILTKPGPLDPEEWEIMRRHTIWGPQILGGSTAFAQARLICRSHHENWDGSGYPDGLKGERIPLEARIVRLADVFDALRSERPYKPSWDLARCLEAIAASRARQFDPELVPLFLEILETTPLGPWVARRSNAGQDAEDLRPFGVTGRTARRSGSAGV
ncbi:MAG TPA: HD-GYP domain-containing protein [Candidatus Limnocylindrales bacterium]|nr:HD-GYP domain-containing protein [Candidatus Limnocylindrales bacterium]